MPSRRRADAVSVQGALWLRGADGELGGLGRMALLRAVRDEGSITAAARAVGMSYKAAWDAIDTMNRHAGAPLVQRQAGGRGGGATRLTAHGLRLLERYGQIAAVHERFVQQLAQRTMDMQRPPSLLDVLNVRTSARNSLLGTIRTLRHGAVNDEAHIALGNAPGDAPGGSGAAAELVAIVSTGSARALELQPGLPVVALIQASAVMLSTGQARLSARNRLDAQVRRIQGGAVNAEVELELAAGGVLHAMVPMSALEDLALAPGQPVSAWIQASDVILATIA